VQSLRLRRGVAFAILVVTSATPLASFMAAYCTTTLLEFVNVCTPGVRLGEYGHPTPLFQRRTGVGKMGLSTGPASACETAQSPAGAVLDSGCSPLRRAARLARIWR